VEAVKRLLLWLIRSYQLVLSPFVGQHCRFWPTCSSYAIEAIEKHGAWRGSWLGIKRIARCHPFHPGGVDPVPEPKNTPSKDMDCDHQERGQR